MFTYGYAMSQQAYQAIFEENEKEDPTLSKDSTFRPDALMDIAAQVEEMFWPDECRHRVNPTIASLKPMLNRLIDLTKDATGPTKNVRRCLVEYLHSKPYAGLSDTIRATGLQLAQQVQNPPIENDQVGEDDLPF